MRLLVLALLCHVSLALGYLRWTPAFEGPDENDHCYFATFVAQRRVLPLVLGSAASTGGSAWDEASLGHHPPLYYVLLAATLHALGAADTVPSWRPNPAFARPGEASRRLHWLHGHDERSPVSTEIRTLWWLRAWSVLLGLATIVLTWRLGRLCFPDRPGIAGTAALLLACLPTWSFSHGVLDNGSLATTLCHATLVVLATGVARQRLSVRRGLGLGALTAAALATKLTSLLLLPLLACGYALGLRSGRRRSTILSAGVALLAVGTGFGPWLLRNALLYGEPLAGTAHRAAFASNLLPAGSAWTYLTGDFLPRLLGSLVGSFGWVALDAPRPLSWAAGALGGLALLGWALGGRGLGARAGLILLTGLAPLLALAQVVHFNLTFIQPQGRYLFPGVGAGCVLLAAGLHGAAAPFARALARAWLKVALAALPPLAAAAVLLCWFVPAFSLPPPSDPWQASLHAGLATVPRRPRIELLDPPDGAVLDAPPTFHWRAPPGSLCTVQMFGPDGRVYFGTWEVAAMPLTAGEYTMAAEHWAMLPHDVELHWKVRQVPERSRGQSVADVPESAGRRLTRSG